MEKELKRIVLELAKKAGKEKTAADALQFTQAALNLAQICAIDHEEE